MTGLVHMIGEEDPFHFCYYSGRIGATLAYMEMLPWIILVVMWGATMLYGTDKGLLYLYNIGTTLVWFFSWTLAQGLRGQWSPEYAHCNLGPFSLPDPYYVTSGTFLLTLGLVGLTGRTKMRVSTGIVLLLVFALYTGSLVYNAYQPLSYFFISLALVFWFSAYWFVVYVKWLIPIDNHYAPSRLWNFLGVNNALSLESKK